VWVANAAQGTVSRVDPTTNAVTRTIRVGRRPVRLGAGFGSIWVANETSQTVSRLDARTGQVQATIPVTGHVSADDLAVGAGSVWVRSGNRLLPLDPPPTRWPTGPETGRWAAGGSLWLTDSCGFPERPSLESARSSGWIHQPAGSSTGSRPRGDGALAVDGGSVWQAGITTQTIYRYDAGSRRLVAQIPIGVVAKHLIAGAGSLWVSSDSGRVTPDRPGDQHGHRHLPGQWPSARRGGRTWGGLDRRHRPCLPATPPANRLASRPR
jgi:YVTN family beta-propeller protein